MSNWKAVGPDGLPAELPKLDHPEVTQWCDHILVNFWAPGEVPQQWKYATTDALHKQNNRSDCNNYRGSLLVAHVRKVLSNFVTYRLSNYCEARGILPEEQHGLRPARTMNSRHAVRRAAIGRTRAREKAPTVHAVHVLHSPAEEVRFCRPRAAAAGTHTLRRTTEENASNYSPDPRRHAVSRVYGWMMTASTHTSVLSCRCCDNFLRCRRCCYFSSLLRYTVFYSSTPQEGCKHKGFDPVHLLCEPVIARDTFFGRSASPST